MSDVQYMKRLPNTEDIFREKYTDGSFVCLFVCFGDAKLVIPD